MQKCYVDMMYQPQLSMKLFLESASCLKLFYGIVADTGCTINKSWFGKSEAHPDLDLDFFRQCLTNFVDISQ